MTNGLINMKTKQENLKELIKSYGKLAVAFSSGVDSTYLLKVAHDVLGDNVIAITVTSHSFPQREAREADEFCKSNGIKQFVVASDELAIEGFRDNPPNRCYICKREIFTKILSVAKANGIDVVAEASNMDDNGDYRPGHIAIKELGIKSPLREAQLYKKEIRALSEELNLPTWNKPSFACLASRFVYGEPITAEKLDMVDKAEQLLMERGFRQFRVRIHGNLARIEVEPAEFDKIMQPELRETISKSLKEYGFAYVSLDLQGYRTGSMNETLSKEQLLLGAGK